MIVMKIHQPTAFHVLVGQDVYLLEDLQHLVSQDDLSGCSIAPRRLAGPNDHLGAGATYTKPWHGCGEPRRKNKWQGPYKLDLVGSGWM